MSDSRIVDFSPPAQLPGSVLLDESGDPAAIRAALKAQAMVRRFDLASPPPEPVPRFFINGKPWGTPRNLQSILAQAGTGKTSIISALESAYLCPDGLRSNRDFLGMSASDMRNLPLLHIDTEQSPYDHFMMGKRTLRRAGLDAPPPGFHSYGLAGFGARDLRQFLKFTLEELVADAGGVFAVIIDGTADMVTDVNNAEECNDLVAELHGLAIKYDTAIINVIHENPGSDTGKARGHLGSQLERKAESALRLKRTDDITVVYGHKMRHAPVYEKDGPRFRWSDAEGMHVSVEAACVAQDEQKRAKFYDLAESVLAHAGKPGLRHGEFLKAIAEFRRIGASAAEDRFTDMKRFKVIQKNPISGEWMLTATTVNPVTP